MKRARNSVRVIALAAALCLLLTMGVFAAENGSVWLTETDTDAGTVAAVITDGTVTDGVVAVRYDADKLTYQSVTLNETYVAMHAVNTEEAGVVHISWIAPAAVAPAGSDWLFRVNFTGNSDEAVTLEGELTGGVITEAPEVDKTELQKAVLEAQALNEAAYTAESWAALADALTAAEAVLADPAATQAEVDAAAAAVRAAVDALAEIQTVDTTELAKAIGIAESLNADSYTAESWAAMQAALESAKAVLADADATQAEVDAATANLQAAVDALVLVQVQADLTQLRKNIGIAEALTETDYTAESWAAMQAALESAKAVLTDADATQAEVDAAAAALAAAVDALILAQPGSGNVSAAELEKNIGLAEALTESDYTAESWAGLAAALENGKAVLADPDATQAELDAAAAALKAAMDALVLAQAADTTELQKVISIVESLSASGYTTETWTALEKALEDAKAVLADPNATQAEVDAAVSALNAALEALKLVDTAELKKTIDVASGLKKSNYTKASWKALETALKTAKAVLADADATQAEVDAATNALKAAIAALKLSDVANTGDEMNLLLPMMTAVFSTAAMVAVVEIMRKNKKEGKA